METIPEGTEDTPPSGDGEGVDIKDNPEGSEDEAKADDKTTPPKEGEAPPADPIVEEEVSTEELKDKIEEKKEEIQETQDKIEDAISQEDFESIVALNKQLSDQLEEKEVNEMLLRNQLEKKDSQIGSLSEKADMYEINKKDMDVLEANPDIKNIVRYIESSNPTLQNRAKESLRELTEKTFDIDLSDIIVKKDLDSDTSSGNSG